MAKKVNKAQDVQRTCSRCGNVWYVPLAQATPPSAKDVKKAQKKIRGASVIIQPNAGSRATAHQRTAQAEVVAAQYQQGLQDARCSNCGSGEYVQSQPGEQQQAASYKAGWYPDPYDASKKRYFDGTVWTEYTN